MRMNTLLGETTVKIGFESLLKILELFFSRFEQTHIQKGLSVQEDKYKMRQRTTESTIRLVRPAKTDQPAHPCSLISHR